MKARIAPKLEETPVCDALLNQLLKLVTPDPGKTSGAERRICHTGQFTTTQVEGAGEQQKATLQKVSSNVSDIRSVLLLVADIPLKKFIGNHTDTFHVLQTVHENIVSANISTISPLKMG